MPNEETLAEPELTEAELNCLTTGERAAYLTILRERDEARQQRDEALTALERVCRWARPRGSGDPLQPALDNGRAVMDRAALAKAGRP